MNHRLKSLNVALAFFLLISAVGFFPQKAAAQTNGVFISEYVEGSSYNKAIEIYNGTGTDIDLLADDYNIFIGGSINTTVGLSGTLSAGDVFVVAHTDAASTIQADLRNGNLSFSGDDAVVLRTGTTVIDAIGQIGFDPGSQWGTDLISTADNTIRRLPDVCEGDTNADDAFDPSFEWEGFAVDTFDGLGTHTANCGPVVVLPEDLFISEYIEGGSSNKAIEIYNGTGAAVDLSAYKVALYSNGSPTPTSSLTLTGTIADGGVYVIANPSANATILGIADATSGVINFNGNDAFALQRLNDSIVDVIGQIGFDPGSAWGTGDITTVNHTLTRMETICNGDTDGSDPFDPAEEWVSYPQDTTTYLGSHTTNCALPTEQAPTVVSTTPADGGSLAKTDNIVITFSEPVTVTGAWFNINCTSSGAHTATVTDADPVFTLNPDANFTVGETCTVTVYAAQVTDDDTEDPPDAMEANYTFDFTIAAGCGDPYTAISAIQGTGETSPLADDIVTVEGIITADYQTNAYASGTKNGFYMQSLPGAEDTDPLTSEGIFVYSYLKDVVVGDHVRVTGKAVEYSGLTELSPVSEILTCNTGLTVTPTTVSLPVTAVTDWEKYESMLVTFPESLVISEYYNFDRFGEIILQPERFMQFTAVNEPSVAGFDAWNTQLALNSITLDDGRTSQNPDPALHPNGSVFDMTNLFRGGDTVTNLTGILDYYAGAYRIQPTAAADYVNDNPRTTAPEITEAEIKVASFNVLNYYVTLDDGVNDICGPDGIQECRGADTEDEFDRQRAKILAALIDIDADIYGLMEIENDSPVALNDAVADLVDGLNDALGAGTYAYIQTGAIGGDAIKQAILYKPASVTPVGAYQILDSSIDARFIDTANRPVLAQVFVSNLGGEPFVVAVNHLKSKGSDCNDLGDPDLGDGAGNCNLTRKSAAEAMVDWLADPTYFPDVENVLIIGDLNSYDHEDPIDAIKLGADDTSSTADDYLDMMREIRGDDAYGYLYGAQIGYLDYAMANTAFVDSIVDVNFWHINADEPDLIDYNMDFKLPAQDALYAPDAYRSSDHDPVIVTIDVNTLEQEITSAVTYEYVPVYEYVGFVDFDDPNNIFTAFYTPAEFAAEGAMNDLARYLGALYRQDGSTIVAIDFNGVTYTWNPAGTLKGSNWEDTSGGTLVSAMVAAYLASPSDLTITVTDGVHTSDIIFRLIVDDVAPVMEEVAPAEGAVLLGPDDTFVLTVDAFDLNLYELEIDHSMSATLPEFSVYASAVNPWGTPEDKAQFDAAGVNISYDETLQQWTIDFGETVTDAFIANGGITFYMVLKDMVGNQWGTMYGTTPENTYVYTLNVPPVAKDDAYETDQDTPLVVTAENGVLANDYDPNINDQLIVDLETGPLHGTLVLNPDGSFTYTPDPGFYGVDTFTYIMLAIPPNMRSQYLDTATVTITVNAGYIYYMPLIFNN